MGKNWRESCSVSKVQKYMGKIGGSPVLILRSKNTWGKIGESPVLFLRSKNTWGKIGESCSVSKVQKYTGKNWRESCSVSKVQKYMGKNWRESCSVSKVQKYTGQNWRFLLFWESEGTGNHAHTKPSSQNISCFSGKGKGWWSWSYSLLSLEREGMVVMAIQSLLFKSSPLLLGKGRIHRAHALYPRGVRCCHVMSCRVISWSYRAFF